MRQVDCQKHSRSATTTRASMDSATIARRRSWRVARWENIQISFLTKININRAKSWKAPWHCGCRTHGHLKKYAIRINVRIAMINKRAGKRTMIIAMHMWRGFQYQLSFLCLFARSKWLIETSTKVKKSPPYDKGPRLLDLMDTAIFDFIIGNADRHHYEVFAEQPDSMVLLLDNAKSFGNPEHDEMSILKPITQCCLLRKSTFERWVYLSKQHIKSYIQSDRAEGRFTNQNAHWGDKNRPNCAHSPQETHRGHQSTHANDFRRFAKVCQSKRARQCVGGKLEWATTRRMMRYAMQQISPAF